MTYTISSENQFSSSERFVLQKKNYQIKCGVIWKDFSFFTSNIDFYRSYDPDDGLCLGNLNEYEIGYTELGNKLIYFSRNVSNIIHDELSKLFSKTNEISLFIEVLKKDGWIVKEHEYFIWGQLNLDEDEDMTDEDEKELHKLFDKLQHRKNKKS